MRRRILVGILSISLSLVSLFLLISCTSVNKNKGNFSSEEDPGMVVIGEGWFKMGANTSELNERPEHDVFLDTLLMDKYEVTASDFSAFLNEEGNPENKYFLPDEYSTVAEEKDGTSEKGAARRYAPRKGFENYPANNVSWYGADAYCRWKGKRLPFEAEWEKAARGNEGRLYPWGDDPVDDSRARYHQKWEEQGVKVMVPVDALPEGTSYYGVFNMAGNCREWVQDWYRQNYCNYCDPAGGDYLETAARIIGMDKAPPVRDAKDEKGPDAPPKYDPKGPPIGSFKVLRGGSWEEGNEKSLRSAYRYWLDPSEKRRDVGFRCAK
jgi:formylglycine-generating enzyme required for sulfatase activity